jgi:hypothetical protein
VLGWTRIGGRPAEIAAALDGEARTFFALRLIHPAAVPVRYLLDGVRTLTYLVRRRPRALIVENPPIFPALLALAYGRLVGAPLVLDSHPSSFGLAGDRLSGWLLPVHAWVARRSATTLVGSPELAAIVQSWGARADVLHEAPPSWCVAATPPPATRPRILFPGIFSGDEPVEAVVQAARAVPEVDVIVTGDMRKCPPGLREGAPENVAFVGFLDQDAYVEALGAAHAIISLSTEPTSVMRTAHEAVWAQRPLIITARPDLRELFPDAVAVTNDAAGVASGMRAVLRRGADLEARMPMQRRAQEERWQRQLAVLRARLGV